MSCDGSAGWEHLTNFDFLDAFICTYSDVVGLALLGLLVYGSITLSIYIRTGSVVIPTVLLLTTGGATLTIMAPPGVQAATVLILCTGGGAIAYLYYRYSR